MRKKPVKHIGWVSGLIVSGHLSRFRFVQFNRSARLL
jgi:hypothetical protein